MQSLSPLRHVRLIVIEKLEHVQSLGKERKLPTVDHIGITCEDSKKFIPIWGHDTVNMHKDVLSYCHDSFLFF